MMKLLYYFSAILCFLIFACNSGEGKKNSSNDSQSAEVRELPIPHFEKMRLAGSEIVIIDVRTPEETAEGIVPYAQEIDYQADDFQKKILELDREKTYVVYCAAGARGSKAAKFMVQNGFKDVYNLEGGYEAWEETVSN